VADFFHSDLLVWLVQKPGLSLLVVALGLIARQIAHASVERVVLRAESTTMPSLLTGSAAKTSKRRTQRAQAVGSLFKSIATSTILAIVVVTILAIFGIPIGPLLASAGIVGVALGFGAQTLVKDYLAGVSMILEDQFGVGDVVDLGDASGTVEAVGLRVTQLRSVDGTVWYVRNGEVVRVGNMSQNWARAVLDIAVSPNQDLDRIQELMAEESQGLAADPAFADSIIEPPEVWGVESVDHYGVVLRVVAKTAPLTQWTVSRALRARIMARFRAERVDVPSQRWPTSVEGSDT
jgi:moderate conductance mechanosensitive channel